MYKYYHFFLIFTEKCTYAYNLTKYNLQTFDFVYKTVRMMILS